jgi:hypothetical protein
MLVFENADVSRGHCVRPQDTTGAKVMKRLASFMKDKSSLRILAFLSFILILEFAGAEAYAVTSAHTDPSDFCFGYAICQ